MDCIKFQLRRIREARFGTLDRSRLGSKSGLESTSSSAKTYSRLVAAQPPSNDLPEDRPGPAGKTRPPMLKPPSIKIHFMQFLASSHNNAAGT
jgi:hypothetical protein